MSTFKTIFSDDDLVNFKEQIWLNGEKNTLYDIHSLNLLQTAAKYSAKTILKFLLDQDYFDIDAQAGDDNTALLFATEEFDSDAASCAKLLLSKGADVDIIGAEGRNAVMQSINGGIDGSVVTRCAELTKNVDLEDSMGYTAIGSMSTNRIMYRMHAITISIYISKGAALTESELPKILSYITDTETSIVWKEIQKREDLMERVLSIAIEYDITKYLPQDLKDTFIF